MMRPGSGERRKSRLRQSKIDEAPVVGAMTELLAARGMVTTVGWPGEATEV
jgi:hypothetical protein